MIQQLGITPVIEMPTKDNAPTGLSITICALLLFVIINLLGSPLCFHGRPSLTKNEVFGSKYELMNQGPWPWWVARAFFLEQPADIIIMGDSQINAAVFQADAFARNMPSDCAVDREAVALEKILNATTKGKSKVVNLAMGGAMCSDQYLMAQALFTKAPPKIVIIGVNPRCFLDNSLESASTTEPFKYFQPFVDMGPLAKLSFPDYISEAAWRIKENVPLLKLHSLSSDFLAGSLGLNKNSTTPDLVKGRSSSPQTLRAIYGLANDVKKGETLVPPVIISGFYDNKMEYARRYKDPNIATYQSQKQFFDAYLKTLENLKIKMFVVNMPCLPANRQLLPAIFWQNYCAWVASECRKHGASWVDLSEDPSFTQNYFLDNVHVNAFGAKLLVQKIASILLMKPHLI